MAQLSGDPFKCPDCPKQHGDGGDRSPGWTESPVRPAAADHDADGNGEDGDDDDGSNEFVLGFHILEVMFTAYIES